MKRIGVVVLGVLACSLALIAGAPPAQACTCEPWTADSAARLVDAHPRWTLLLGEQVGERDGPDNDLVLTFRVDRIYSGAALGDRVDVLAEAGAASCGPGSQATAGLAVFLVTTWDDGDRRLSQCGEPLDPALVDVIFDGLPDPMSNSPPEFLVAHDFGGSTFALLDRHGHVTGYAEDEVAVRLMAACPGAERIGVIAAPLDTPPYRPPDPHTVEIRSVPDLALITTVPTEIVWIGGQRGTVNIVDFDCHDSAGDLMTFLAPAVIGGWPGAFIFGQAKLHVIEAGVLRVIDVGVARSVAVDPETRRAYTINTVSGQTLTTWDLDTGAMIDERPILDTHVGWHIDLVDGQLMIVARQAPLPEPYERYPVSNTILIGAPDDLTRYQIPVPGGFVESTRQAQSLIVQLRKPEQLLVVDLDGTITQHPLGRTAGFDYSTPVAVGADIALTAGRQGVYQLQGSAGEATRLKGVGPPTSHVVALVPAPDGAPLPEGIVVPEPAAAITNQPAPPPRSSTDPPSNTTIIAAIVGAALATR